MHSSTEDQVVHVTTDTFEREVIKSELPVVIDFWAPWCGPCRALGPIVEKLSVEWQGRVKTVKVNVDDEPELANAFQISSIPTMVALKGKQVLDVQIGMGGVASVERLFYSATENPVEEVA